MALTNFYKHNIIIFIIKLITETIVDNRIYLSVYSFVITKRLKLIKNPWHLQIFTST